MTGIENLLCIRHWGLSMLTAIPPTVGTVIFHDVMVRELELMNMG